MLTDRKIGEILEDMVVIVDSREKKNEHILKYLNDEGIKWRVEKLDSADYSFVLPNYPQLEADYMILIEKKNSLTEIAGNFTSGRERFIREFERLKPDQQIHLVIETATWKKVANGSYRSQLPPKSMRASLLTFHIRYDCPVWFVEKTESPELIYSLMRYELLEYLKNLRESS